MVIGDYRKNDICPDTLEEERKGESRQGCGELQDEAPGLRFTGE